MEENYIPQIFNYCDRWCERCRFTSQCRVFAEEAAMTEDQLDIGSQAYWDFLDGHLQSAIALVKEKVEDFGGNWQSLEREARANSLEPRRLSGAQERLKDLAGQYASEVGTWFQVFEPTLQARNSRWERSISLGMGVPEEAQRLIEALEVIHWYMVFIGAKMDRALFGLHRDWESPRKNVQSDANGSAKIALIAVERSLEAWETVRISFPEYTNNLLDILLLLERLRRGLHTFFPNAQGFIRPGFDQPGNSPTPT